jgi:hypothetical protein
MGDKEIIGLVGDVRGSLIGFLTSYLNNQQERKWRLKSEFAKWKRQQITDSYNSITPLLKKFNELAHRYYEHC